MLGLGEPGCATVMILRARLDAFARRYLQDDINCDLRLELVAPAFFLREFESVLVAFGDGDEAGGAVEFAELCGDKDFAGVGLGEDAVFAGGVEEMLADGDEIGEAFVFIWRFGRFEQHVVAAAGDALDEVAPIRRKQRALELMRTWRENARTLRDEQIAGAQDALVTEWRAWLDYDDGAGATEPRADQDFVHFRGAEFGEGVAH